MASDCDRHRIGRNWMVRKGIWLLAQRKTLDQGKLAGLHGV